jgi:metallo-beta-lactamase family protein
MTMEVQFLGAAGTVTGSKFLIRTQKTKILIDCGLYQGLKELRLRNWQELPFKLDELDAIVLSHAHIDHSGYIPVLTKQGFSGPIYCTLPTRELCSILLPDCGYLQREDADYANRKGFSKHHPALPLYDERDGEDAIQFFKPVEFGQKFTIGDLKVELQPAGHILGAANIRVTNQFGSILFSGDIGRSDDLLELPPPPVGGADCVVMESTYGNKLHPKVNPIEEIAKHITRVVQRGGVLIIPSFAVGRTQILLYTIQQAFERGLCPHVPVFVNSPMATKVTSLYRRFVGWHALTEQQCEDASRIARFVATVDESKALHNKSGPMVIISASGMLTGGRVLHHLEHFGPDHRNAILLAGFQAPGTRGAALADGISQLKMHGQYIPINAEVIKSDYFSAHADQQGLLNWLANLSSLPKRLCLVHGEATSLDELRRMAVDRFGIEVVIPKYGDTLRFGA